MLGGGAGRSGRWAHVMGQDYRGARAVVVVQGSGGGDASKIVSISITLLFRWIVGGIRHKIDKKGNTCRCIRYDMNVRCKMCI